MLDIGEVAEASGLTVATLRYYEERGLIESCGRVGLRRQFDNSVRDRLSLIALGQRAGFSLDDIRDMLPVGEELSIDRDAIVARADEIDEVIDRLRAVSDNLRHTAACPATNHLECPSFQRLLARATRPPAGAMSDAAHASG